MSELPKGWEITALSNVLDKIVGGGTPSKNNAAFFNGSTPFMTVKDLKERFPKDTIDHISPEAIASSATTLIQKDCLIVATRMSLGKIVRPQFETAINQDLKALFLSDGVDKTFVEYFWRSQAKHIESLGTGTTVKGIRLEDIRELKIPLPPHLEQKRIADKLDNVLARLDACRERLARVQPLLKRFRQSVLAVATSGALTADWRAVCASAPHADARPSDYKSDALAMESPAHYEFVALSQTNCANLFAAMEAQAGRYAPPPVAETEPASESSNPTVVKIGAWSSPTNPTLSNDDGRRVAQIQPTTTPTTQTHWKEVQLSTICTITSGFAFKSEDFVDAGTPAIKISNIQYGQFEEKNQEYLPESYLFSHEKFTIQSNDLLLAMTRPITNDQLKICRYPEAHPIGLLNQRVCKLDFNLATTSRYFEYAFQSPYFIDQIRNNLSETLQPNLSPKDLGNFLVELPPLAEQHEIAHRIETLFAFADRLEARLAAAQNAAERLTPALLAKAFRGELVPQDPNDEPAAELLKRLAEARATTPKPKRGRKGANIAGS